MDQTNQVRKLVQWETQRMRVQFRADMWMFARRMTVIGLFCVLLYYVNIWEKATLERMIQETPGERK